MKKIFLVLLMCICMFSMAIPIHAEEETVIYYDNEYDLMTVEV